MLKNGPMTVQFAKSLVIGFFLLNKMDFQLAVPFIAAEESIERRLIPENDVGHGRASDLGVRRS